MTPEPKLIAETPDWWVIDKPSGWLSIPGRGEAPVLSDWVKGEIGPVWIVHRLDRDTSGVMLFARSAEAHRRANGWFEAHEITKLYECIVQGILSTPVRRVARPVDGAPAVTQLEVRERWKNAAWIQARPLSGKRHQIRLHLRDEGCPLWGDVEYGGPREVVWADGTRLEIPRVALHARSLTLPGGARFEAPLPSDMREWHRQLLEKGNA